MAAQNPNHVQIVIPEHDERQNQCNFSNDKDLDYSQRAQWLRAAMLGANDGLVSIASLMMGVGAVKEDAKVMVLTGFAGLFAGACSMAIGEFVSVYSQLDIEIAQMKKENRMTNIGQNEEEIHKEKLPNPSGNLGISPGLCFRHRRAVVPLLAAAFIESYKVRLGVVVATVTLALIAFAEVGAVLGGTSVARSCPRVVVGGWMAMGITFGLTKLIGSSGLAI